METMKNYAENFPKKSFIQKVINLSNYPYTLEKSYTFSFKLLTNHNSSTNIHSYKIWHTPIDQEKSYNSQRVRCELRK